MPDQFGNPLPGEAQPLPYGAQVQPGMVGIDTGYTQPLPPVAAPVAPPPQQFNSFGVETNAPAQAAPVAPSAQPAKPTQQPEFVSKPGTGAQAPAGNPFAVVGTLPGGTSTTTATVDLGAAGKKAQDALTAAGQSKIAAGEQFAAIGQERADARALHAAQAGDAAAKADSAIQLHNEQVSKDSAAAVQDIKRASDDYERAAADLGPDHFWQQQGTGQKIGNIIAIAMSGIGNAFSAKGGINARNGALDLINAAIDRDIDMQKTALAAKERGIRTKESLYQQVRQKGADDLTALSMTKAASLGKVDRQLEAAEAKAGTKEAQANLADLRANVQAQQAAELQRVAELTAKRVQSTSSSTPITALQMQQMQAQGQQAQAEADLAARGLVKKNPALEVPGFGQATDPESKRELVKAKLAFDPADKALKVLEQLGKKTVLGPADEQLFDTARSTYLTFINGPYGANLGALAEGDKALLDEQVPARTVWKNMSGKTEAMTNFARDRMDTAREALKGYTVRTQ